MSKVMITLVVVPVVSVVEPAEGVVVVKALVWDGVVLKISAGLLVIDIWSDVVVGTRVGVVVINAVNAEAIT